MLILPKIIVLLMFLMDSYHSGMVFIKSPTP